MPARKATSSGKWSQSIWDVTPSVGDDVFANNFTIEIDQDINVGSLRTTLSSGYAVAGGGFTLYQPLSVIASPRGFIPSTGISCITTFVSSGTARLSGNMISYVTAGTNAVVTGVLEHNGSGKIELYGNAIGVTSPGNWRTGVLNKSNGQITIFGTVSGSSGQNNYGAYNTADGTIEVYGNVLAGATAANRADGIWNNSTGLVKVFGNVTGTNAASNGMPGITNNSVGSVIVTGNVDAGTIGSGITQNSTGTLLVSGTITASANAHGVVSANTAARNEFTGTLVNSISGRQAVYCAKYLVHPKMFDSATVQAVDISGTYVTFYAPEAYSTSYVPHTSSVALGTAYAAVSSLSGVAVNIPVQLSGTMIVPSAGSVSLGTLVGQTSGTAILNSQDLQNVWNTNINTLTTDGTIFKRLANSATVSDVGTVLQNINL
jgi:hypothetical protein